MQKRYFIVFLICAVILPQLIGCNCAAVTDAIGDRYEALCGTWEVGGLYYGDYLIDLSDNSSLSGLYDATYLFLNEGEEFLYINFYYRQGTCANEDDQHYILKTDSVFTYDFSNDGIEQREIENFGEVTYLLTVLDGNTIQLDTLNSATGSAKTDSFPLLFVKEGEVSSYLQSHKTALNTSSNSSNKKGSTQNDSATISSGKRNALKSAKSYLSVLPFSYIGLIKQLEYEGYTHSEAIYAAENCGADWYEQAVMSAEQYLSVMAFSRSGLIEQLEYEGYTHDQAVYGVNKAY